MEVEKIAVSMFLSVLLASCFLSTVAIDYLDTDTLIVRQLPNDQRALFGYSAVLHSLDPNGSIDNIRYAGCCVYVYLVLSCVIILL